MRIKIAVAHHKKGFVFEDEVFFPIQVGAALSDSKLNMQGDDTGENVSLLNPYYCEMSAMYWLWKNEKQADYLGLCHYRRYFTYKKLNFAAEVLHGLFYLGAKCIALFKPGFSYSKIGQFTFEEQNGEQQLRGFSGGLKKILKKNPDQLFCAKKIVMSGRNVAQHLSMTVGLRSVEQMRNIVKELYPDYTRVLDQTLNSNSYRTYNMIVFSREVFDQYCRFVFGVLEKHREKLAPSLQINACYLRVPGYLAEVLTDVFIRHRISKGGAIKELNTLFMSSDVSPRSPTIKILNKFGFFHPAFDKMR